MRRLLVAVGAMVSLVGCSSGESTGSGTQPTVTVTETQLVTVTARPPAPRTTVTRTTPTPSRSTPEGVKTAEPGETLAFTLDDKPIGTITVETIERYTEPRGEYGEPPENGSYILVTMTVRANDDASEPYSINPFNFYVQTPDGTRWDQADGSTYREQPDADLESTELNPGEQIHGSMVFDAAPEAYQLVYAPGSRAIGVWHIP